METKSRYEIIYKLESEKRELIKKRDSLDKNIKLKQREIKEMKREVEEAEEDLKMMEDNRYKEEDTYNELIKSIQENIERITRKESKS